MEDRAHAMRAAGFMTLLAIAVTVLAWTRGGISWWMPVAILGVGPLVYWRTLDDGRKLRNQRVLWRTLGSGRRSGLALVAIVGILAASGPILASLGAWTDELQQHDCMLKPGDEGSSTALFAGPKPTLDPTGLVLTSAGQQEATSNASPIAPPTLVQAEGPLPEVVASFSLFMRQGNEWMHEGTIKDPDAQSGFRFHLAERGPYDALRWDVRLQEPAADDHDVRITWSTLVEDCA